MRNPSRSRGSKYPCYSNCENDNADLEPQCEKYSVVSLDNRILLSCFIVYYCSVIY